MNNLGYMYENGYGTTKDILEAFNWYKKAAEQGDAVAMTNLGKGYYNGTGVAKNEKEAEAWLKKAIEKGNNDAKTFLEKNIGKSVHLFVYFYEKGKKEAVIGASINLVDKKGKSISQKGTVTDFHGNATMRLKIGDRIRIGFVGCKYSYLTIGDKDSYEIRMYEE
jgi:hypothetical protein